MEERWGGYPLATKWLKLLGDLLYDPVIECSIADQKMSII